MFYFYLFLKFSYSIISYKNISLTKGESIEFDPSENLTNFFFFNSNISGILSNDENETKITQKSFSVSDSNSLKVNSNITGFSWILNSSFCPRKIYELSTQQLLYLQAQYPKREEENDFSCIFFNNQSPKGTISISIFGEETTAEVYSTNEDGELIEIASCADGNKNNIKIQYPFFLKIGYLPALAELFIDLDLDDVSKDNQCYSLPIARYSEEFNGFDPYKFGQITMLCTDRDSWRKGVYLLIIVVLIAVIVAVVILYLCCKDKFQSCIEKCCSKCKKDNASDQNEPCHLCCKYKCDCNKFQSCIEKCCCKFKKDTASDQNDLRNVPLYSFDGAHIV